MVNKVYRNIMLYIIPVIAIGFIYILIQPLMEFHSQKNRQKREFHKYRIEQITKMKFIVREIQNMITDSPSITQVEFDDFIADHERKTGLAINNSIIKWRIFAKCGVVKDNPEELGIFDASVHDCLRGLNFQGEIVDDIPFERIKNCEWIMKKHHELY